MNKIKYFQILFKQDFLKQQHTTVSGESAIVQNRSISIKCIYILAIRLQFFSLSLSMCIFSQIIILPLIYIKLYECKFYLLNIRINKNCLN